MKSSIPSLIIETPKTNIKGATAVIGVKGDMILIDCTIAIPRKKTFANRLNCDKRLSGRKLNLLYFVVRI